MQNYLYSKCTPRIDNDRLASNVNDIVENLKANNFDLLQVFLNKKQVLEISKKKKKDDFSIVKLFLHKDPEAINSLFWFIKDCLNKTEYTAGIECFLTKNNPFYGIQTARLDNPEENNENKTNTNTKSLLNFIINKESYVEYLIIFSIKKLGSRDDEAKRGHLRLHDQARPGMVSPCM